MCTECGCGVRGKSHDHHHDHHYDHHHGHHHDHHSHHHATESAVDLARSILSENDHMAAHSREHFNENNVFVVNLMSSPGAGKTSLLEATISILKDNYSIAVIEGDLETENDADRIRAQGIPCVQITTGTACHLDAEIVHKALHDIKLADVDILFIENVGNLVCPASFDLGQHADAVLLSTPEGDDKPSKYPVMFREADIILLTKTDLLPLLEDFSTERAHNNIKKLANPAPVLEVSTKNTDSLEPWLAWLEEELKKRNKQTQTA